MSIASLVALFLIACGEAPPPAVTVPSDSSAKPASSSSPPPTTTTTSTVSDAPPPASPPSPDPPAATTNVATAPPPSPPTCDAVCTGSVGADLQSALQKRAAKSHRCYDTALATDPKLQGKVVIEVSVAADGRVCSSKVISKEKGMDAVATCVSGSFGSEPFPTPVGGCVTAKIPVAFVPKK